jgi:hypothetical protein
MNRRFKTYLLRDAYTPLSTLTGAGLLVMASSRLAFALTAAAGILWVYGLTVLLIFCAQPIYPKRGSKVVLIFLAAFMGSIFLFLLWFISPLLAMGTVYIIILVPGYCVSSGLFVQLHSLEIEDILSRLFLEAGSLGLLIIAFALIREPIGFMSLSLPGGSQGIIEVFHATEEDSFLPIKVMANSAGALLLLGYGVALFYTMGKQRPSEER